MAVAAAKMTRLFIPDPLAVVVAVLSKLAPGTRVPPPASGQVGAALLRSERTGGQVYRHPLDVCVATTQGEIGYILEQANDALGDLRADLRAPAFR